MKTNLKVFIISLVVFTGLCIVIFYTSENKPIVEKHTRPGVKPDSTETKIPVIKKRYGLQPDSFHVIEASIKPGEFLSTILDDYGITASQVAAIAQKSKDIFSVRKFATGNKYTVFLEKDSIRKLDYFVYEINPIDYLVYDLRDSIRVYLGEKEVVSKQRELSGLITSSLYQTIDDAGGNTLLALHMANIFAWTIDFYRIQKNDWFKIIYDEEFVDDKSVGIGKIYAVEFKHWDKDFKAVRFTQDSISDYFDENGQSLRKAFLKAPLKFSRITSRFTLKRYHPVQKRWKAHLGTDYAAPTGTPIMATGDGVIIAAAYKKYNGNYVKIRHNSVYTTQYLHMSKIGAGIKSGVHVKQGDIIGYVGSTGLATGPHVCYRFWKNGKQVNHLSEDFPASEPVKPENLEAFNKVKAKWLKELASIEVPEIVQ